MFRCAPRMLRGKLDLCDLVPMWREPPIFGKINLLEVNLYSHVKGI